MNGRSWPAATETGFSRKRSPACNDSSWRKLSFAPLDPAPKLTQTGIPFREIRSTVQLGR